MHALRQSDAAANYCLFNNLVGFDLCHDNGVVKRRYVSLHFGSAPPWAGSAKLPRGLIASPAGFNSAARDELNWTARLTRKRGSQHGQICRSGLHRF
jgi:hypothetical protein